MLQQVGFSAGSEPGHSVRTDPKNLTKMTLEHQITVICAYIKNSFAGSPSIGLISQSQ
jgi:hypothetical protein